MACNAAPSVARKYCPAVRLGDLGCLEWLGITGIIHAVGQHDHHTAARRAVLEAFPPQGNGFVFKEFSELSFFGALSRALEIFRYDKMWRAIVKRAMSADFSWESSASKYLDLYQRAIEYHKESMSDNPAEAFRK